MTFAELIDVVSEYGIDAGKQIKKGAKELSKYDKEDVLAAIGLEPKRSVAGIIIPAVGYFAVGVLAGVELSEALVRETIAQDGTVDFLPRSEELDRFGGIAAKLRW